MWILKFSYIEEKMGPNILRNTVFSAFLASAIFTCYVLADEETHWRYFGIYGVHNWSAIYPDCSAVNHTRQSPVNIARAATEENAFLTTIELVLDGAVNGPVTIVNNGHTVNLDFNPTPIHITGGDLSGKFRVGGVHFHWGEIDTEGSEHTIDGKRFPMEMHVVTYDENRYAGVTQASGGLNSIAVLSVLFQLSKENNSAWNPVLSHFRQARTAGQPTTIPYFVLGTLFPQSTSRYYRYLGSLTTPPCSESVVWTVFEDNPYISSRQLVEFRWLQELTEPDGTIDYLVDNWRETQPLSGRKIQRSFTSGIGFSFNVMSQIALIGATGVVLQLLLQRD